VPRRMTREFRSALIGGLVALAVLAAGFFALTT
jgi:hypothetical protein